MTHALRQHCGSFLYDNIRRDWLSDNATEPAQSGKEASSVSLQLGSDSLSSMASQDSWQEVEENDCEGVSSGRGAPTEWPLFDAPVLSSVRITGVVEAGGCVVSGLASYHRVWGAC